MNRRIANLPALVLLALGFGCQQPASDETSQVASLDNVVKEENAGYTAHQCGKTFAGNTQDLPEADQKRALQITASAPDLRNAAIGVLMDTPEKLKETFFGNGGKIVIGNEAASKCRVDNADSLAQELAGSNAEKLGACWARQPGENAPTIYIAPVSSAAVRYHTLRMLIATWVEFFVEGVERQPNEPKFNKPEIRSALAGFKENRQLVADEFMKDVKAKFPEAEGRLLALRGRSDAAVPFANAILIDAAHSALCNDATRKNFQTVFQLTHAAYFSQKSAHAIWRQFKD